jgi:restriction system protein
VRYGRRLIRAGSHGEQLLEALFAHYDHFDDDLKVELPLKRIWTVAAQEDE